MCSCNALPPSACPSHTHQGAIPQFQPWITQRHSKGPHGLHYGFPDSFQATSLLKRALSCKACNHNNHNKRAALPQHFLVVSILFTPAQCFHAFTPPPLCPAEASALRSCRCVRESRSTQQGWCRKHAGLEALVAKKSLTSGADHAKSSTVSPSIW